MTIYRHVEVWSPHIVLTEPDLIADAIELAKRDPLARVRRVPSTATRP
jgi:hypothetical protein